MEARVAPAAPNEPLVERVTAAAVQAGLLLALQTLQKTIAAHADLFAAPSAPAAT